MDRTKVKLRICGIDCTITSDDNEEYVRTLGGEIDRAISAVLQKNNRISLSMAAIITAMTYCDDAAKAKAELLEHKAMTQELHRLQEAEQEARTQAEQLRSELELMRSILNEVKPEQQAPEQQPVATEQADPLEELYGLINLGAPPPEHETEPEPPMQTVQKKIDLPETDLQETAIPAESETMMMMGDYTVPKPPYEPELPSDETFLGYFTHD